MEKIQWLRIVKEFSSWLKRPNASEAEQTMYIVYLRDRVRSFNNSTSGRILTDASTVAAMTVLVKIIALVKEKVVAYSFGLGDSLDAFYIAIMIPTFLLGVFGQSFNPALIPAYVELREAKGTEVAQRLLSSVSICCLALLSVIGLCALIYRSEIMSALGSGFGSEKLAVGCRLVVPLLFVLPLSGLVTIWRATLTVHNGFAISSAAPVFYPICMLITVLLLSPKYGVFALVFGMVLGASAELTACGVALRLRDVFVWPRWRGFNGALKMVLQQYAPMVPGALLMGSTTVVDQSMAAMLGSGSVSALNYANKLLTPPLAIGVYAMSVALLPSFSELSARRDWKEMRRVILNCSHTILIILLPVTFICVYYAEPLVRIVFRGGAFTASDVRMVARVEELLALQIPFYAIGLLYVQAISALRSNQVLLGGTIISVAINASLNLVFMRLLGLPGIALSTSLVYAVSCGYLYLMLSRILRHCEEDQERGGKDMCVHYSG